MTVRVRALYALLIVMALALVGCGAPERITGLSEAQIATIESLVKVDDHPLYTMRYEGGYTSARALPDDGGSHLARGPLGPAWGCSLFAALGDPNGVVYGRNFDWQFSPALLLFTDPPGGLASVSMVDIAYLSLDDEAIGKLHTASLAERTPLLDAPTIPFDGMNERGLVVGMAAVPPGNMTPVPQRPDIGSLGIIRAMLDHAADVDEAVAILKRYDIVPSGGPPLHYLVADATGRAVLVEYHRGEIHVLPNERPWHVATNFLVASTAEPAGQRQLVCRIPILPHHNADAVRWRIDHGPLGAFLRDSLEQGQGLVR